MRFPLSLLVVSLLSTSLLDAVAIADWPQWRGPGRDGISDAKGLISEWGEDGPPLLWETEGLGRGYSSIAIADGKIFTMGQADGGEQLMALDVNGGTKLWSVEIGKGNPNCTPTVDGNRVYALGREGELVCADTASGKIVWQKNFKKDFDGYMMSGWGYSESPLVDGDLLVCTPGGPDAVMVALNKETGELVWKASLPEEVGRRGKDGAGYSSIVVSEACGIRQYVQLIGRGVIGVDAKTGSVLWTYNRVANGTANIPTPLVRGDYVFCSSGYRTGAALLHLVPDGSGVKAEEVYFLEATDMQNHHGGMILLGDYVYCGHGHNQGYPLCVNLMTGEEGWRPGRGPGGGSAAVTYADGHLYFRYEDGTMALIEATPEKFELKGKFKIHSDRGRSWPHPVISEGKLYLRDQDALLCYDISQK